MKPEQMDHGSKEQYSGFEGADTPFSEPVYVDAEVQTDLTASDIDVMADCKEKLENNQVGECCFQMGFHTNIYSLL